MHLGEPGALRLSATWNAKKLRMRIAGQAGRTTHLLECLEVAGALAHLLTVEQQMAVGADGSWPTLRLVRPHSRMIVQRHRQVVVDQILRPVKCRRLKRVNPLVRFPCFVSLCPWLGSSLQTNVVAVSHLDLKTHIKPG
jgi:hypothetical protein